MEKQFKNFKKFLNITGFTTEHFSSIIIDENRIIAVFKSDILDELFQINEKFISELNTTTTFKFGDSNIQFKWKMPIMSL